MSGNAAGSLGQNVRRCLWRMLDPQAPQELAACGIGLPSPSNATASKGQPQQPSCSPNNHRHQADPQRRHHHLAATAAWSVHSAASLLLASSSSSSSPPPSPPPAHSFLHWGTYRRPDGRRYATRSWAAAQSDTRTPACGVVAAAAAAAGTLLAGLKGIITDGPTAGSSPAGSSPPPAPAAGIAGSAAAVESRNVASVAGTAAAGAAGAGFGARSAPAAVLRLQNQEPADTRAASPAAPPAGAGQLGSSNGTAPTAPTAAATSGRGGQRPAAQQPPAPAFVEGSAYGVYDAEGAPSSFDALLASLDSFDVVLLGEYHDDPVAHHLQLRVLQHVLGLKGPGGRPAQHAQHGRQEGGSQPGQEAQGCELQPQRRRPVALSLEMFERDVQVVMDEYLAGALTEADFLKDARPWPNYQVDYRPMVLAAKQAGAPVVCANAPRRYVGLVGRSGAAALESLPPASRQHLPPLPLRPASRTYAAKIGWTMQRAREAAARSDDGDDDQDGDEVAAPLAAPNPPATANASTAAAVAPVAASTPVAASREGAGSGGGAAASTAAAGVGGGAAGSSPSGSGSGGSGSGSPSGSSSSGGGCPYIGLTVKSNFIDAQNLWDATMAASIAGALKALAGAEAAESGAQGPDGGICRGGSGGGGSGDGDGGFRDPERPLVVHVCGKFHSEQRLGICEHLAPLLGPEARVGVVTFVPSGRGVAVPSATLVAARLHTYGDWLVLTDARLPRSFESEHPV